MRIYSSLPDQIVEKGVIFKRNPDSKTVEQLLDGKRFRTVSVLSRNLRGKTNSFGKPYLPTKWIYTED